MNGVAATSRAAGTRSWGRSSGSANRLLRRRRRTLRSRGRRRRRRDRRLRIALEALLAEVARGGDPAQRDQRVRKMGKAELLVAEEAREEVRKQEEVEAEVLQVEQVGRALVVRHELRQAAEEALLRRRRRLGRDLAPVDLALDDALRDDRRPDRYAHEDEVLLLQDLVLEPLPVRVQEDRDEREPDRV